MLQGPPFPGTVLSPASLRLHACLYPFPKKKKKNIPWTESLVRIPIPYFEKKTPRHLQHNSVISMLEAWRHLEILLIISSFQKVGATVMISARIMALRNKGTDRTKTNNKSNFRSIIVDPSNYISRQFGVSCEYSYPWRFADVCVVYQTEALICVMLLKKCCYILCGHISHRYD